MVFTETERLIHRELFAEDAAALFEMDADPEVYTFLGMTPVDNIEGVLRNIEFIKKQYKDNGIGRWALVEKATGAVIGWAGLKLIKDAVNGHKDYYDVGYRLVRRFWGKGYATEAAKASIAYGFEVLGVDVLYAIAHTDNMVSIKVLEKCGFERKREFDYDGVPHYWFELARNKIHN